MTEIQSDIDRYRRLLEKDPDSRVFAPLAEACRKAGLLQEALEIAREGVNRHPAYASGRVALARVLLSLEDFDGAAGELESAIEAAQDNALAFRLLGEARARLGDRDGSFEAYARALALNPEDEEARREIEGLGAHPDTEEDSPAEVATEPSAGNQEAVADAGEKAIADAGAPPASPEPDHPEAAGPGEEVPRPEAENVQVSSREEAAWETPVPAATEESLEADGADRETSELDLELEPLEEAPDDLETLPSGPPVISDQIPPGAEPPEPSDSGFWSEEALGDGDRSGPDAGVLPEAEADGEPCETPPGEASLALDPSDAPPFPVNAPPVAEERAGLESPEEVPGSPAEALPGGEGMSPGIHGPADEGLEKIDTIQSSLAPEADDWSEAPPAIEDPGVSPQALEAPPEKPEEEPLEASGDEGAGLDTRAEEVADQFVGRGQADHGRAIYRSILAHDPLNLRVRKKLLDLGPESTPSPGVTVPGDPGVRQKVEENIETLNRWLANIKKGANR